MERFIIWREDGGTILVKELLERTGLVASS